MEQILFEPERWLTKAHKKSTRRDANSPIMVRQTIKKIRNSEKPRWVFCRCFNALNLFKRVERLISLIEHLKISITFHKKLFLWEFSIFQTFLDSFLLRRLQSSAERNLNPRGDVTFCSLSWVVAVLEVRWSIQRELPFRILLRYSRLIKIELEVLSPLWFPFCSIVSSLLVGDNKVFYRFECLCPVFILILGALFLTPLSDNNQRYTWRPT